MSIKEIWRRHERRVVIHWHQRAIFSWEENTFHSVGQTRMQHNLLDWSGCCTPKELNVVKWRHEVFSSSLGNQAAGTWRLMADENKRHWRTKKSHFPSSYDVIIWTPCTFLKYVTTVYQHLKSQIAGLMLFFVFSFCCVVLFSYN